MGHYQKQSCCAGFLLIILQVRHQFRALLEQVAKAPQPCSCEGELPQVQHRLQRRHQEHLTAGWLFNDTKQRPHAVNHFEKPPLQAQEQGWHVSPLNFNPSYQVHVTNRNLKPFEINPRKGILFEMHNDTYNILYPRWAFNWGCSPRFSSQTPSLKT